MTALAELRAAGWDTETTDKNPRTARIVTAAITVRGGGRPDAAFTWLINPGVPIPAESTAIHGIDDAKAQAEGQPPAAALAEIADKLEAACQARMPLAAFNTSYDWTVLACDLERHGLPTMADRLGTAPLPLLDPHTIDRHYAEYVTGSGQRKLGPTCARYGVELTDWHTAEADALAALLLADAQCARYRLLDRFTPEALYEAQQKWRAEQQADLQHWFRTKATAEQGGDPHKVLEGDWPLIPAQREGATS